jgi:DNA-binding NarL/FixJ family response regulator
MSEMTLRVMVVDDHEVVRQGVRALVGALAQTEVVAEASDGAEALDRCRESQPQAVLMDVDMPRMSGVEATRRLRAEMPEVGILMFTVHEDEATIFDAVRAGADGYIPKSAGVGELGSALSAVRSGGAYLTPLAAERALRYLSDRSSVAERSVRGKDVTTAREREILEMLARGMSARSIATELGIGERTVNTHVAHIYRRLGVRNRVDAVREGIRLGIVDPN